MATRSSRCSRSYQRLNSASSNGSMSIDVSSIAFPASGISDDPLSGDLGGQIRDCLHHGIPDAGIIERMAGALDATNFGFRRQLDRSHEAVVLEIMRFHEWRGG